MGALPAQLVALDRKVIEELAQAKLDEAHALLALLDRLDGDPDLEGDDPAEEAGDEHDMSWPNGIEQHRPAPNMGTEDDEHDDQDAEHDGREPDDGY